MAVGQLFPGAAMSDAAVVTSHLSRYLALLRISTTLARHRTIGELFEVLADELHPLVPFDYLGLVVHEESTGLMRLVVLEPSEITPAVTTAPLDKHGPAVMFWQTQRAAVIPRLDEGALQPTLECIRGQGRRMTCWLPLTTAHRKVGVLCFGSRSSALYTEDVVAFMEQVAAGVAIAVENGMNREEAQRYEHELREERDRLRFLLDVNNLLVSQRQYPARPAALCAAWQGIHAPENPVAR